MSTITKAWDEAYNRIQDTVAKAVKEDGKECFIRYSAYDTDEYDTPINNLHEVPIKGKIMFVDEGNFWEGVGDGQYAENYTAFKSEVMDSPTWLEIAVVANRMILSTDDKHHCFLESLDVQEGNDGVKIATIMMGS